MTKPKPKSRKLGHPGPPTKNARAGVHNSRTSPKRIARAKKMAEAMQYREQGYSFEEIATELKIGDTTAYDLVVDGLKSILQEPAEQLLAQQIKRTTALLTGFYSDAKGGDDAKLASALRLLERLDRLYGIAQPAQKLELTGAGGGPIETKEIVTDEDRAKALAAFVAKFTARKQGGE